MEVGEELVALVPASVALAYRCVPVRREGDVLTVALAEPFRSGVIDDLELLLRCEVVGVLASRPAVERAIRRSYGPPPEGADGAPDG
jgi:type IV pilus assembly protein PilB